MSVYNELLKRQSNKASGENVDNEGRVQLPCQVDLDTSSQSVEPPQNPVRLRML